LLAIFLFNPERDFFLLELVSLLRTGRGGVQRELANLVAAGVIERRKSGVKVLFRRKTGDDPVLEKLEELVRAVTDHVSGIVKVITVFKDFIRLAVLKDVPRGNGRSSVKIFVVTDKFPDDLAVELKRLEVLYGVDVDLSAPDYENAKRLLAEGSKELGWLEGPDIVTVLGDIDKLLPGGDVEEAVEEKKDDLFSSAGLTW